MQVEFYRTHGGLFTSPFGGEVGAQRRVRGPSPQRQTQGPLTRPKRVDLSPEGRGKEGVATSRLKGTKK